MSKLRSVAGVVPPQLIILLLLVGYLSWALPESFPTLDNGVNIAKQISVLAIVSAGLTLVAIGGWLDLSVGSTFSLLSVMSVTLQPSNPWAAVLVPLAAAVLIGTVNGAIVGRLNANSIVVTLGSLSVVGGIALLWTNGATVRAVEGTWYSVPGRGVFLGVPLFVYAFLILVVIYELILRRTVFGRSLRYVGTNPEAARIAGVSLTGTAIGAFVLCSAAVAVAALLQASRVSSADPMAGAELEFNAITAIVIGGVSLRGGKGTVIKTLIGVLLLSVIENGLRLYNVPFEWQYITKGLLILIALVADTRERRTLER